MKKLSEPVKGALWFAGGMDRLIVSAYPEETKVIIPSAQPCYIVPAALWQRAQKALKASKKKGRGK